MRSAPIEIVKASEARQHFAQLINRVYRQHSRVIVEKSGIPVAAVVSLADLERLTCDNATLMKRMAMLEEMRAPFRDVPSQEIEIELDRALREVRAEMRAEREENET